MEKISLYGFNNLTKSLSYNIYDVCYAKTEREQRDYIAYIDKQYNSERLVSILKQLTEMIGATVLNISTQDYQPQGASATFLISEHDKIPIPNNGNSRNVNSAENAEAVSDTDTAANASGIGSSVAMHLDKSHLTVHTYPEYHPDTCIATFRVDIDISTCGEITPLSTLDYLISSFDSDIIAVDYRVRGFTRNVSGEKVFIDHNIKSIQDYICEDTLRRYDAVDVNVYHSNIFHTQLLIKDIVLQNYLFNADVYEISPKTRLDITNNLRREMIEIFSGSNIYGA